MRKHLIYASIALLWPSLASAGAVTTPNTFTAGTPARAADVNANFTAVKTAVDDNDTRITTNTNNITATQNTISTNATNINTNASNITANTNSITANANAITTNTTASSANATAAANNAAAITANTNAIATNASNITAAQNAAANAALIADTANTAVTALSGSRFMVQDGNGTILGDLLSVRLDASEYSIINNQNIVFTAYDFGTVQGANHQGYYLDATCTQPIQIFTSAITFLNTKLYSNNMLGFSSITSLYMAPANTTAQPLPADIPSNMDQVGNMVGSYFFGYQQWSPNPNLIATPGDGIPDGFIY